MYDCCSIQEIDRKWLAFLVENEVPKDSWHYQMYEVRKIWCAAYHMGKCYLGLRSNQRSESMNSRLQMKLVLTLDFGKSDVIEIIKQSAIRVNMKAGSQRLLSMKPGACLLEIHT